MGRKSNNKKIKILKTQGQETSSHMAGCSHPFVEKLTTARSRCLSSAIFLQSWSNTAIAPSVELGYRSSLNKAMPNFINSTGGNVSTSKIFLCTSTFPAQSRDVNAVLRTSPVRDEGHRNVQPEIILVQVPGRPYEDRTSDEELRLIPALSIGSTAGLSCHCAAGSGCQPPQFLIAQAETNQNWWKLTQTTLPKSSIGTSICSCKLLWPLWGREGTSGSGSIGPTARRLGFAWDLPSSYWATGHHFQQSFLEELAVLGLPIASPCLLPSCCGSTALPPTHAWPPPRLRAHPVC